MAAHHVIEWVWGIASGITFGVGAAMAHVSAQMPDPASFPWEKVNTIGGVSGVLFCVWIFLKRDEKVRTESNAALEKRDEVVKSVAGNFASTMKESHETFADTTATLLREARSEAAEREKRLQELFHTIAKDKP